MSLISFSAIASVISRPDYIPDENHPINQKVIVPRQAEEERPQQSRDEWKEEKEERKIKAKNKFKRLPKAAF
jgi:hypothetical protein